MRRGKLNKKSIILIFIVAIFTIFSYGFDQLVIRTEDKLRNLKINFQELMNSPYIEMNKNINESLKKSVNDLNYTFMMMDSGAGHDTAHLAKVSKASIIFIPCQNGLSHCPEEFTESINIKKGSEVILKSVLDLKDNYNEII